MAFNASGKTNQVALMHLRLEYLSSKTKVKIKELFDFLTNKKYTQESVFIFQFLNDQMYNYVLFDIIVDFVIQKLKNKHTFPKSIQTEQS